MEIHHISPEWLTLDKVEEIIESGAKLVLSEESRKRISRCREFLDNKMKTQSEPIYGLSLIHI